MNETDNILGEQQILRVATDVSKVNKALHSFTIDARVGGDMNENNKLFKKAQERLKAAVIVFTTCAVCSVLICFSAGTHVTEPSL